ncbi:MAG TPA: DUF5667 domain-containing protein [Patescibacteria group bacterium]
MLVRVLGTASLLIIAVAVLLTSVVKASAIEYNFTQKPSPAPTTNIPTVGVVYNVAYPGIILPDSPLWPLKVLRDRIWLSFTFNPVKKSELYLLLADKRLASAQVLYQKGKSELATSVLTKAEKYLEASVGEEKIAKEQGLDTSNLLHKLSLCSLKHREVIDQLVLYAPEDAKPRIVETGNYPKRAYDEVKVRLSQIGVLAPKNPFTN